MQSLEGQEKSDEKSRKSIATLNKGRVCRYASSLPEINSLGNRCGTSGEALLLDGHGESMTGSLSSAHALLAGVVGPSQAKIIHPPNLWNTSNGKIDANGVEILEGRVEGHGCENAVQALQGGAG